MAKPNRAVTIILIIMGAVALLCGGLCALGFAIDPHRSPVAVTSPKSPKASTPTPAGTKSEPSATPASGKSNSIPAFKVVEQRNGTIVIEVDQLLTKDQMIAIVKKLRSKQSAESGYWVRINCSTGASRAADNRLGNARFAIGTKGKAATGLNEGEIEVQVNEGRSCPAPD